MTSHRLQVAVAPVRGAASTRHYRTDGNGHQQTTKVVLDKGFVASVCEAYCRLDLTQTADIVVAIWGSFLGLPVLTDATKSEIEAALLYLSDADEILLLA